ncbi:MAG: hypothetical protein U1F43_35825 [Myxococcota bacterium]
MTIATPSFIAIVVCALGACDGPSSGARTSGPTPTAVASADAGSDAREPDADEPETVEASTTADDTTADSTTGDTAPDTTTADTTTPDPARDTMTPDTAPTDVEPDAADDPPPTDIALDDGIIPLDARQAFCTEMAACDAATFDYCMELVDEDATIHFYQPGCDRTARLLDAMRCFPTMDDCGDTCNAELEAWYDLFDSPSCLIRRGSIGIGDRFPPGDADAVTCASGAGLDGWCSAACELDSDCAGSGPQGRNHFGTANRCALNLDGYACYPTCTSSVDCQNWFGATVDGARMACIKYPVFAATCSPVGLDTVLGVELP